MQTVYVDIYFLINFTIDFLALYFACAMTKMPTTIFRLLISGSVGAVTAVVNLLIMHELIGYFVLLIGFLLMVLTATKKVTLYRRFKLAFCFSIAEMLLGGMVYLVYGILDEKLGYVSDSELGGSEHRELLILAAIAGYDSIGKSALS